MVGRPYNGHSARTCRIPADKLERAPRNFREILGIDLSGAEALEFDVALHVATVLSTIVVLWREFLPLCVSFFTLRFDSGFKYVCKILVSCIPVAIVGLCFKDVVESFFGTDLTIVGICLIATAALLSFAYFSRTRQETKVSGTAISQEEADKSITWGTALTMGVAQAIAVLPGLSRSGSTIATGISLGANRAAVARFSFFMVIIPILGEALLGLKDIISGESSTQGSVGVDTPYNRVHCRICRWVCGMPVDD